MFNRWQATKWRSLRKECYYKLCASKWHLRRFHRNIYKHLTASDINRASGYILNNLMLTASEAMPATWGLADASYNPTTVERLQTQQIRYFTEKRIREKTACKSLADVGMPWQSSAIGDGKLCLTAGKPQSGTACVKGCYHKLCASKWHNNVRRLRRRYIVWDSILRRFRCATPAVKHSKAPSTLSSQYI